MLGFEPGLVTNSVPNAIGSSVTTSVQKNVGITLTALNNTMNIDFQGFATKTYSILVGGPYSLAAIATYLNTSLFTASNIPVTCTYNAGTQLNIHTFWKNSNSHGF